MQLRDKLEYIFPERAWSEWVLIMMRKSGKNQKFIFWILEAQILALMKKIIRKFKFKKLKIFINFFVSASSVMGTFSNLLQH